MSLASFFLPRSIALVGATEREGSVGRAIWENLRGFSGPVFPVNAKRTEVCGVKAYPTLAALPEVPELVIIMTPASTVPLLVEAAGVAGVKAVIVISAGFKETGAEGAKLEAAVLDAALRQSGVLRVDTIEELFDMAEVLAKQPLPTGRRLAIVTNAGGPGALATDALVLGKGELAELSPQTMADLNALLPACWSHHNPVDVLGDADAARFAQALRIVARDPAVDGVLAILTPQAMTHPTQIAHEVAQMAGEFNKPLLASWMGAQSVQEGRSLLNATGVPTYDYPDEAALAFVRMREHRLRLIWLSETQTAHADEDDAEALPVVSDMIDAVLKSGRTLMTELEAKQLLQVAGIPIVETRAAYDEAAAITAAEALGYPVVVKLLSPTITHKSDCGGVQLNLLNAAAVQQAWRLIRDNVTHLHGLAAFEGVTVQRMVTQKGIELILGLSTDAQFGPVLLIGAGGTLVEVLQDHALALPPLNHALARRWVEQTRIAKVLHGVRGQLAVDLPALDDVLVKFARLVQHERRIVELDINPLLATSEGILALDARVVVRA